MNTYVYDAAVLIAADRDDRSAWLRHRARVAKGNRVIVPAPVVAQVSRSSRQAQLRRFLASCMIAPFGERDAHEAGRLLAITRTADIVDAAVVRVATRFSPVAILTGDTADIERLVTASGRKIEVIAV